MDRDEEQRPDGEFISEYDNEEEIAYILGHTHEKPRLMKAGPVDLGYVTDVLDLKYAFLREHHGSFEIPEEDEWIVDAVDAERPSFDWKEETAFILAYLYAEKFVVPGLDYDPSQELIEAILDAQYAFLQHKGIAPPDDEEDGDDDSDDSGRDGPEGDGIDEHPSPEEDGSPCPAGIHPVPVGGI